MLFTCRNYFRGNIIFLQPDEDNDDEVEEEEEQNSAPWRPPTPPKASPKKASLTSGESPALESTVSSNF